MFGPQDLVTGPVPICIIPSLPFKGVPLLLGNGLAEDKVVVNPLLTRTSCVEQQPDLDLYPSCEVTRTMAKKAKIYYGVQAIHLNDSLIGQSFNDEISSSLFPSYSDIQTDFDTSRSNTDLSPSMSDLTFIGKGFK